MARNELGRALRAARHEQGTTLVRVSAALGVPAALVARWEHGDALPDPQHLRALAGALRVESAAVDEWLELRARAIPARRPGPPGAETITVEILAPPRRAAVALAEPAPPPPAASGARQARGVERRAARRTGRTTRGARGRERGAAERAAGEARRRSARTASGASAPPVFAPDLLEERSHVIATVNTGAVFPVPGERRIIDKLTYSTAAPTYRATEEDRMVYRSRWIRVVLIMAGLAALLWWAVAQLGDGWDAVLDLFRSDDAPTTTIGALVLGWLPR